ncbi:MAG: hypothetical protein ACE5OY_07680 [Candidatus Bathyarchaeia archaeon]
MRKRARYDQKVADAALLVLFRRHRVPGAKGWELKKRLGSDYPEIIELLNRYLDKLGLQIRTIFDDVEGSDIEKPTRQQLDKARFMVTVKNPSSVEEDKLCGWRIDDIAALAVTTSLIASKGGRAIRKDIERVLKEKLPAWRVNIDKFVQSGYLNQDDEGNLEIGWRTRAEVDVHSLMDLLLK